MSRRDGRTPVVDMRILSFVGLSHGHANEILWVGGLLFCGNRLGIREITTLEMVRLRVELEIIRFIDQGLACHASALAVHLRVVGFESP